MVLIKVYFCDYFRLIDIYQSKGLYPDIIWSNRKLATPNRLQPDV